MPNYCYTLKRREVNSVTDEERWVEVYPAPDGACPACSQSTGSPTPPPSPISVDWCEFGTINGNVRSVFSRTYTHSGASATIYFKFNAFSVADELIIKKNGTTIVSTGCMAGTYCGSFTVAEDDDIQVIVDPTCATSGLALWEFTANCDEATADCESVEGFADLSLVVGVSAGTSQVGQQVNFSITVTNNGPEAATNIVFGGVLQLGIDWGGSSNGLTYNSGTRAVQGTISTLASGASVTKNFFGVMTNADADNTRVFAAQIISCDQLDPDSVANSGVMDGQDDTDDATVTLTGSGGTKLVTVSNETDNNTIVVVFIESNGAGASHSYGMILPNTQGAITIPDTGNYRICLNNILTTSGLPTVRLEAGGGSVYTGDVAPGAQQCINNQTLLSAYYVRE